MILSAEFDKFYAKRATRPFVNKVEVKEIEARDTGIEVRRLRFVNVNGCEIPHRLLKKTAGVFKSACDSIATPQFGIAGRDCDGIFLVDKGATIRMNLCELKTTANIDNICDAKDQIIGSYIEINSLLRNLQSYTDGNLEVVGFIVSHGPKSAIKSMAKDVRDPRARFYLKLMTEKEYTMPKNKMEIFYHPLKMPSIKFYFVEVPARMQQHQVDYQLYA